MLVLSRKKKEIIDIDDGKIEVTVVDIRGDCVKIGIKCDRSISVNRREVQLKIDAGLNPKPNVGLAVTAIDPKKGVDHVRKFD